MEGLAFQAQFELFGYIDSESLFTKFRNTLAALEPLRYRYEAAPAILRRARPADENRRLYRGCH